MRRFNSVPLAALLGLILSAATGNAAAMFPYFQTNLVSDLALPGVVQDPNLKNPWGVSESSTSPLWISDQAQGVATLYMLNGLSATLFPAAAPLMVPSRQRQLDPKDPPARSATALLRPS